MKKNFVRKLWRDRSLVLMSLPAVILLVMFDFIPMTGLSLAFKRFDYSLGLYKSPWVGLENFKNLFLVGDTYWRITRNTVGYYILHTAVGTVCKVGFALAINELAFRRAGKYIQSVVILPTFISYIAVSYVVNALLDYSTGMINTALANGGTDRINFYLQPQYWPLILTIVALWKNTGYGSVLYMSVLAGIDQGLYESAELDGASSWQKIRYISIPMLVPMISINLLLSLGNIMKSGTGLYYQVTQNSGALYETTQTIDAYLLNALTKSGTNWGTTAAATFYQSVVGCLMLVGVNLIVRKMEPERALF